MEYALKYQKHLRGLLVANMVASAPEYGKYAAEVLAKQMKPAILSVVRECYSKRRLREEPIFLRSLGTTPAPWAPNTI